jgi:hypothetical protein
MPGLLRGVARTAVVAGTATAVGGRVRRRQDQRWAQQDAAEAQQYQQPPQQQYAPPPQYQQAPPPPAPAPAASQESVIDQLQKLGDLKQQGILTDAEFAAEKAKLLG